MVSQAPFVQAPFGGYGDLFCDTCYLIASRIPPGRAQQFCAKYYRLGANQKVIDFYGPMICLLVLLRSPFFLPLWLLGLPVEACWTPPGANMAGLKSQIGLQKGAKICVCRGRKSKYGSMVESSSKTDFAGLLVGVDVEANMGSKIFVYVARRAQEPSGEGPGGFFLRVKN